MMRVYNTLSRSIEDFHTLQDGKVRVYICGMTVYDDMHIGHARTYLAFDAILRYLRYVGYQVKYIQNITDVDDKIIKRATEKGIDPLKLSAEYAQKTIADQQSLGLVKADAYPKVSQTIPEIIAAIKTLIEKGFAYDTEDGVYYDISKFQGYGRLSNQDTEQLSQHRIEPSPVKKNQLDFSLWKKTTQPPTFESPWGTGRPGWHIECSAMSQKHLGDQIDIHGGALDLIFPHHENEIAQSEAITGKQFVRYWMHTGFLCSSGAKMSKSLGNILPVRELLKKHNPNAFRLFVLQTHYRSPIDYSEKQVGDAEKALQRLTTFRKTIGGKKGRQDQSTELAQKLMQDFRKAMDEDFNTPQAIAAVFETVRQANKGIEEKKLENTQALAEALDEVLKAIGIELDTSTDDVPEDILKLIQERNTLRKEKNWAKADEIRDQVLAKGYAIKDLKDGSAAAEKINATGQ